MAQCNRTILVSNDDGVDAEGLARLVESLSPLGEVVVVAPAGNQSAVSHSLTLGRPLRVRRVRPSWFSVDGTPTDCVNIGCSGLLRRPPGLVVSGINAGLNVGDDITYSGTVAAAIEGTLLGIPSIAVSMDRSRGGDWKAAERIARRLALDVLARGLPEDTLLNVNVPAGDVAGARWTRQGRRMRRALVPRPIEFVDGEEYWISDLPPDWAEDPMADWAAVLEGWASVTPLHLDLTHHRAMRQMADWPLLTE